MLERALRQRLIEHHPKEDSCVAGRGVGVPRRAIRRRVRDRFGDVLREPLHVLAQYIPLLRCAENKIGAQALKGSPASVGGQRWTWVVAGHRAWVGTGGRGWSPVAADSPQNDGS